MSAFRVGQRVKLRPVTYVAAKKNDEGTVLGPDLLGYYEYTVRFDRIPSDLYYINGEHLIPLTDPKSESWAADKVKQLTKPIHVEPTITKERVK